MKELVNELMNGIFYDHIIFLIFFIIIVVLSVVFYRKIVGVTGEFWVRVELRKLPKNRYFVLNDIMVKTENGTHQIDHIVISKYGIFVIETKNYDGLIVGDEYKDKWIQYLGKNKYYFKNPIHQNYGHIKALKEILQLDESKFISIVCLSNRANVKVKDQNVTQVDFIDDLIKSYKTEILNVDLNELISKIEQENILDKDIRRNHVKNIKNTIKENERKEDEMVCPKCGGKMVERQGKYGKFIGCSNYPKCKYTMNIKD